MSGGIHALQADVATLAAQTANYTMAATDRIILATNTITITLPASPVSGFRYTVKNVGTGIITVAPSSGTIDGAATFSMPTQYQSTDFISDGTNWWVV